jgi:hypothetical protein
MSKRALIRLAQSLPKGSPERKTILRQAADWWQERPEEIYGGIPDEEQYQQGNPDFDDYLRGIKAIGAQAMSESSLKGQPSLALLGKTYSKFLDQGKPVGSMVRMLERWFSHAAPAAFGKIESIRVVKPKGALSRTLLNQISHFEISVKVDTADIDPEIVNPEAENLPGSAQVDIYDIIEDALYGDELDADGNATLQFVFSNTRGGSHVVIRGRNSSRSEVSSRSKPSVTPSQLIYHFTAEGEHSLVDGPQNWTEFNKYRVMAYLPDDEETFYPQPDYDPSML